MARKRLALGSLSRLALIQLAAGLVCMTSSIVAQQTDRPAGPPPEDRLKQIAELKDRAEILQRKAAEYRASGYLTAAISSLEKAIAIERQAFGDHPTVLETLNVLASLHEERANPGDLALIRQLRQEGLTLSRKLYAEDHWRVINARFALESFEIISKLKPDDQARLGDATRMLAKAMRLANNDSTEVSHAQSLADQINAKSITIGPAIELARRTLQIRRELLGDAHARTGEAYDGIGRMLLLKEEPAEAVVFEEKAVAVFRATFGTAHPITAQTLINLGIALSYKKDHHAAAARQREALEILQAIPDPPLDITEQALEALGNVYRQLSDGPSERQVADRRLDLRIKENGPDSPSTTTDRFIRIDVYQRTGASDAVRDEGSVILANVRKSSDPELLGLLPDASMLMARVMHAVGEHGQARALVEEGLAEFIRSQKIDPNLKAIGKLLRDKSPALIRDRQIRLLSIYRKLFDEAGRPVVTSGTFLGFVLAGHGAFEDSRAAFAKVKADPRTDEREAAFAGWGAGTVELADGHPESAVVPLEASVAWFRRNPGAEGLDLAECLCDLGSAYFRVKKFIAARGCQAEAVSLLQLARQGESDLRATALMRLADAHDRLHDSPAARASMTEGLAIRRKLFADRCQALRDSNETRFAYAVELWYDYYANIGVAGALLPSHYEQIAEIVRQVVPKNHPATVEFFTELAKLAGMVDAEDLADRCREDATDARKLRPATNPSLLARPRADPASSPLADLRADPLYLLRVEEQNLKRKAYDQENKGKFEEALATLERLRENVEKQSGPISDPLTWQIRRIIEVEEKLDRWDSVVARYRKIIDIYQAILADPLKRMEIDANGPGLTANLIDHERTLLAKAEFMARLTPEQRARLTEADRIYEKAETSPGIFFGRAKEGFRQALAIRSEILGPTHEKALDCRDSLIDAYQKSRDLVAAAREADEYVAVLKKEGPGRPLARALGIAGQVARSAGKIDEQSRYLEEAIQVAKAANPPAKDVAAEAMAILGANLSQRGDFVAASRYYEAALAEAAETSQLHWRVEILLGWARAQLFDGPRAEQLLQTVIGRDQPGDDDNVVARVLEPKGQDEEIWKALARQGLGYLAQLRGDLETARMHYDAAAALIRESRANAERPINEFERAIAAQGIHLKAMLASELGDHKTAYRQLSSLIDVYRKFLPDDDPTLATLRGSIAMVLMRDKEYKLAEGILDKSIETLRKTKIKDDPRLVEMLVVRGSNSNIATRPEAAREDLEEALGASRRINPKPNLVTARALVQLGLAYLLIGDLPMARQRLDEAQGTIRSVGGDQSAMLAAHATIAGMVTLQEKDPKRAASELRLMLENSRQQLTRIAASQTEREQLGLLREFRKRFDMYLWAATRGEVDPADLYRELLTWKGAVTYRQGQERSGRDGSDADVRTLLADLQEVDRALAAPGQPKTAELEQRRESLERELLVRSAGARKGKERASRTPADIRSALPDGSVLVDFLQFSQINSDVKLARDWGQRPEITAFVLRKDSDKVERIDLGPARPIAQLIEKWRASYGSGQLPPKDEPDPAEALRDLVWKPLKPHLGTAKLVFLSPDGPLSALPFPALPGEAPGTFLLEDVSFVIMPVPQRLPDLVSADALAGGGPSSLLVIGDVNFDAKPGRSETRDRSKAPAQPTYRALPGTRAEIDAVQQSFASRFPDGGVTTLRQDAATKDRFIGEGWRHRYLHLATHGFFASESVSSAVLEGSDSPSLLISELQPKSVGKPPGLLSGLAFAGANRATALGGDNGILTAQEAAELNLQQAELVVLSACDTGLGRVAGLEGVLGLQRSFQVAGARTVVASLWSVEDSATRTLMSLFYRNLWEKKLPKGEALRQAQIEMIHHYRFDASSRQVVDLRGGGKRINDPEARRKLEEQLARLNQLGEPLPPFFWAAFVLSGDWR